MSDIRAETFTGIAGLCNRSYVEFCWYGPNPAAPIIQASGTESVERASIVRRQLR